MHTSRKSDREAKYSLIEIRSLTVHRQTKILLQGKWVRKCGFEPEDKLTVWIYPDRIVIEKEKPDMVDTKLLVRVLEQLRFVNGEIKIKD